jgi:hypothetical protein
VRIHFERSGGVGGLTLTTSLDTAALSPEQAHQLRELLARADFFQLPATLQGAAPGADRFVYKVSAEGPEGSHSLTVDEAAAPPLLRPLLKWLTATATSRAQRQDR